MYLGAIDLIMYTASKILLIQGILLWRFLCDRVQGVERSVANPRHFPCHVPLQAWNSFLQNLTRVCSLEAKCLVVLDLC